MLFIKFSADAMLSEFTQSQEQTNIILQRQKELGHRLPLGSYLVLPIQRILRYHLLLKVLQKIAVKCITTFFFH